MRFVTDTLVSQAALVATNTSSTVDMSSIVNFSLQIVWTSTTASFSIAVEVSNDSINWTALGTPQAIADNNGDVIVVQRNNPYAYMRVVSTRTSGTLTTLKVIYHGKGF